LCKKKEYNLRGFTLLLNPLDMVYLAIVKNQYTMLGGIGIHHRKHTVQPKKKLVSIVAALLDVTVDDAFGGYGRQ
jgi:hypothetical protein